METVTVTSELEDRKGTLGRSVSSVVTMLGKNKKERRAVFVDRVKKRERMWKK